MIDIGSDSILIDFEDEETAFDLFNNGGWLFAPGVGYESDNAATPSISQESPVEMSLTMNSSGGVLVTTFINSDMVLGRDELLEILNDNGDAELRLPAPTPSYFRVQFFVPSGVSTVRWIYNPGTGGEGNVWVDQISLAPVVEDGFETGDFSQIPWNADEGWVVDESNPFEGASSAHFPIDDTIPAGTDKNLTFPVDSEYGGQFTVMVNVGIAMPYDYFGIYVDDEQIREFYA